MSDKRQETIADIVAEMRSNEFDDPSFNVYSLVAARTLARGWADRIEAAWKREVETTTEKFSAVGKVAQEMLFTSMQAVTAVRINGWAVRLAEVCEQPVTDCNQLGNAAKMREALKEARRFVLASAQRTDRDLLIMDEKRGAYVLTPKETLIKIDDVLSAPPRNCDRFATFDDARNTFFADYMLDETRSSASAFAIWLFDKAKGDTE